MKQDAIIAAASGIAFALATMTSTAAAAQLKPEAAAGSRIKIAPKPVERERAGTIMKGFARCIYRQHPAVVQRLVINSDPVAIDYAKVRTSPKTIAADLGMPRCLGAQQGLDQGSLSARFTPILLRAKMLEEDYLAKFRIAPVSDTTIAAPVRSFVAGKSSMPRAKILADFSDCIAAKDVAATDAVLRTMPGDDDERAAARRLVPVLGACLDKGVEIELTPAAIRIYAADGLWTRFVRPQAIALAVPGKR